jgi:hypothetical protein
MRLRFEAVALAASLFAAIIPASASAQVAKFRASLSGTYTQQGSSTNSRCYVPDGDDSGHYVSMTGTSTESDSFQSVKPITLTVSRVIRQKTVDAGSFQQLATKFTLHRESQLVGTDTPAGCDPSYEQFASPPDCGTKTKTFKIRVYGRQDKPAFSFLFSNGFNTIHPDDPFTSCFLAGGGLWPGFLETSGPAPVKPAKVFNRHVRTIVVHGVNQGMTHPEAGTTGSGVFKLDWTLTLKRI